MRRLVAQVFLEAGARVGVDDSLGPLGEEERPPRRQLGIVELEEMVEVLAIVEDVDLDRVFARPAAGESSSRPMSRSSACRQRTAGGSSAIGKFEKTMNGPVRTWYLRRDQRLAAVEERAQPDQPRSSRSRMAAGNRPGRRVGAFVRRASSLRLSVLSGKRPAAPQVPRPLGPHRPLDRPPEALPVVEGRQTPGKIRRRNSQRVGPGPARDRVQADAEPRQVLDPAAPRAADGAGGRRPGRSG